MVYKIVTERILVAMGGIILYISLSATEIGNWIDEWAIWIMIPSILLILFSKKISKKFSINDDVPVVFGGTALFLSGKKFLIPIITGNIAWIAIGIAIIMIVYKKQLADLILR